jgi:hypothetical protein
LADPLGQSGDACGDNQPSGFLRGDRFGGVDLPPGSGFADAGDRFVADLVVLFTGACFARFLAGAAGVPVSGTLSFVTPNNAAHASCIDSTPRPPNAS